MVKASNLEQRRGSEKAQAILEGAMQEFMAHGYAATSMDRIAAAARVSKPTLYSYFQDKEGLFTALIQELAQEKFRAVWVPQDSHLLQGEPSAVLERLATEMLDTILKNQELFDLIRVIIGESGRFPALAQTFLDNLDKPLIEALSHYLTAHPELKLPDPRAAAHIFDGLGCCGGLTRARGYPSPTWTTIIQVHHR